MKRIRILATGRNDHSNDCVVDFGFTVELASSVDHLIGVAIKIAREKTGCDKITLNRIEISTDGKTSAID